MTTNQMKESIEKIIRNSIMSIGNLKLGLPKTKSILPAGYEKYTHTQLTQLFLLQDLITKSIKNVANLKFGEPKVSDKEEYLRKPPENAKYPYIQPDSNNVPLIGLFVLINGLSSV